jgi:hypothetical protein
VLDLKAALSGGVRRSALGDPVDRVLRRHLRTEEAPVGLVDTELRPVDVCAHGRSRRLQANGRRGHVLTIGRFGNNGHHRIDDTSSPAQQVGFRLRTPLTSADMSRRVVQPQRSSAALVLPAIDAWTTPLERSAAPISPATAVHVRASLMCPPGQPVLSAATRIVCERPPPQA